jgi:redox-sensitive bicupin YhaK (pirin superfamily)
MTIRKAKRVSRSNPTIEGAGVRLKRVFGYYDVPYLDPFLLLDHFGSENPDDYLAGFPWHPHRGIETITYMLHGEVEHGDSLGNGGVIGSCDSQWMTAGSGIIHQEMPKRTEGLMRGFQLWANLPASQKMMEPRYRDVKKDDIPTVSPDKGVSLNIICGEIEGTSGPVKDIVTDPEYFDVRMTASTEFVHSVYADHNVFAFVYEGEAFFGPSGETRAGAEHLVLFDEGDEVYIKTGKDDARFLLVSGKPIGEPVAWRGPIVMNTDEELRVAFSEYRNGTFIKHKQ